MKLTVHLSKPAKGFYFSQKGIGTSATLDGYRLADRLLEGVMFEAELVQPRTLVVTLEDSDNEDYMDDLNAFKFFKMAAQSFVDSGGRNSSSRCLGLDGSGSHVYFIGNESTESEKRYHFDCDPHLLTTLGFRSYDGEILDFSWEE